jgi:hypothetical protein
LVQDYVFRPVEYSQVSLYDWICLSHIEKCPKEIEQNSSQDVDETESDDENDVESNDGNNSIAFHHFLKEHPLHHSHHVRLLDDVQEWVPNCVGGAVPRSDRRDRNITALLC